MKKLNVKVSNEVLQWTGTACFVCMYALMSFNMYPWNVVAGLLGSTCYMLWTIRVANKPQMIVNAIGITFCFIGLFKAWA